MKRDKFQQESENWYMLFRLLIFVFVIIIYFIVSIIMGRSMTVYVVNGLEKEYQVYINEQIVTLPAHSNQQIKLPLGQASVRKYAGDIDIERSDFQIEMPFFTRPFAKRAFVINPDRTAIVVWEQTEYFENLDPNAEYEYPYEIHVGSSFYTFKSVEYPFQEFPEEILMSTGKKREKKERIYLVTDYNATGVISTLIHDVGENEAIDFCKNQLRYFPSKSTYLTFLSSFVPPQELADFTSPYLDHRPVLVEWHKTYQDALISEHKENELGKKYKSYLAAEPNNSDLLYLMGRVTMDPDTSEQYFIKAISQSSPSPHAYSALAYCKYCCGEYEAAYPLAQKAVEIMPDEYLFKDTKLLILRAAKRYDEIIAAAQENSKNSDMPDYLYIASSIKAHLLKGDKDKARKAIANCKTVMEQAKEDKEYINSMIISLEAMYSYTEGNFIEYKKKLQQLDTPLSRFKLRFYEAKWQDAASELPKAENGSAYHHLVLSMAAKKYGNNDIADKELKLGLDEMKHYSKEEKLVAEYIEKGETPDPAKMAKLAIMPADKRVLLTLLGFKYQQHKPAYFQAAQRLNVDVSFPYYYLNTLWN